ncbi:MAG: hypothetical protein M1840_007319 [Geoglossum simile]|nr:MAG: hypothetical protein M1840_007319 [Geoglossum simile]
MADSMSHQESIPVLTTVYPPVPPPSLADRADISDTPTHHTNFRHPAYPPGEDLLLRLPAFDHPDGGLTYAVALDCLTIITANAIGGYLAKTRDGPAIDVTRYDVLMEKDYFFIVPRPAGDGEIESCYLSNDLADLAIHLYQVQDGSDPEEPYKYPICPSFADWIFPHNCLPTDWSSQLVSGPPAAPKPPSGFTEKVLSRDNACVLTGRQTSIQACHLCPRAEDNWFWRNSMHQYVLEEVTRADYAIDDFTNGITLRADLHIEFDACGFVFMRKSEHGYTVHCLRATPDILPAHHNRQTRPLTTIRPEFIYTRLAYAIFPRVSSFLSCGWSLKKVVRLKADSGVETEIVDVAAKEFRKPPPMSQNSSPRKRSQQASMADDESYAHDLHSDPYQALFSKRKRARASSSTTGPQPSTPPALQSAPTSGLSEKELQYLREAWVGWQRPPGYTPLQKGDGERMDFTQGLHDERKGDFEGESPLDDWNEVVEASS